MKVTIKAARVNVGLTLKDAAAKIGVTKETLSRWERGLSSPTLEKVEKLAAAYQCTPEDFLYPKISQ